MNHRKPSTMVRTTRRAVAATALAVPLTVAGAGLASASDDHDHPYPGATAVQDGGLIGVVDLGVDPAVNVGGILNNGPVFQQNLQADGSNSGIMQTGFGAGGFDAFQAASLVEAAIGVDPAVNVGGILNSGPVQQFNHQVDGSNSGIVQSGGHGGGGGTAIQQGGLLGLDASVSPALNIGGILSGGGVYQGNVQQDGSNSGIVQS